MFGRTVLETRLKIGAVENLPSDLDELVTASLREDFRAVQRLREEWKQGINRFEEHGEALFEARLDHQLVAICGLNRDPYAKFDAVARLRHLYVTPEYRLRGIGRELVAVVLAHAAPNFRAIRLRTDRADADRFYLALGFEKTPQAAESTHQLRFTR